MCLLCHITHHFISQFTSHHNSHHSTTSHHNLHHSTTSHHNTIHNSHHITQLNTITTQHNSQHSTQHSTHHNTYTRHVINLSTVNLHRQHLRSPLGIQAIAALLLHAIAMLHHLVQVVPQVQEHEPRHEATHQQPAGAHTQRGGARL